MESKSAAGTASESTSRSAWISCCQATDGPSRAPRHTKSGAPRGKPAGPKETARGDLVVGAAGIQPGDDVVSTSIIRSRGQVRHVAARVDPAERGARSVAKQRA